MRVLCVGALEIHVDAYASVKGKRDATKVKIAIGGSGYAAASAANVNNCTARLWAPISPGVMAELIRDHLHGRNVEPWLALRPGLPLGARVSLRNEATLSSAHSRSLPSSRADVRDVVRALEGQELLVIDASLSSSALSNFVEIARGNGIPVAIIAVGEPACDQARSVCKPSDLVLLLCGEANGGEWNCTRAVIGPNEQYVVDAGGRSVVSTKNAVMSDEYMAMLHVACSIAIGRFSRQRTNTLTTSEWENVLSQAVESANTEAEKLAPDFLATLLGEVSQRASMDPLTGVLNRGGLVAAMRVQRHKQYSIAIMDVDYFKAVNDTFGHAVGDEVLIEVAATLRRSVRPGDLVARWGGEEFVVVLPGADVPGALVVADRMRAQVEKMVTRAGLVTASFGVASAVGNTETLEAVVGRADIALYAAKKAGRNRCLGQTRIGDATCLIAA
jgi:diguanylate cyclase (GGDEF)-like protein